MTQTTHYRQLQPEDRMTMASMKQQGLSARAMTLAAEEFATVQLRDKRLNSRLLKLAEQLAAKPTASIPGACGAWGDTAAAYRMLDNERCDWREIIEAHGRCTVQRMAGLGLCCACTTPLSWTSTAKPSKVLAR